ncbi:30S ribosomal protein S16-2, chloroplastic/mitochondrial [Ricinus communis]|uniref:Mitochondrial ribosomal protein S16, putative n=1 Tax=Ricinus communis TaxID=3988 RepID=B9SFU5_RICCO|nr:30S ribosomal protein S16-2, chloroplastic/mitochondrial [Ricinus communis]EEF37488.1 mitochondrial ribosomal protein S16, putative [Ricinus communis]|eukprot:XP_002524864.1 30S ribosomal protein S16-2, chloroplastic/mitochondrial [Ricinus communis]
MAVKIRLERCGCKNRPFYRIIAADSKSPRDGKLLQVLGFYDPLAGKDDDKRIGLKFDRVNYWLSVGAQPSDPVRRILLNAGLLSPPPMVVMGHKNGPGDRRPADPVIGDA